MDARSDKRLSLVVMAVVLVAAFAFQGTRGLYATTESRYAESSREMLTSGDWLVPQLNGEPHWTKPPLSYWTIAGGMALLGVNEWGARLSSAVAFAVTAWAVMQLGTLLWDRRTGALAALVYATAPFTVGAANTINTDSVLTLWMSLVVLAYWKARRRLDGNRSAKTWIVLLWLFAGLAFLTKGPPSLLALLVVVICHAVDRRRGLPLPRLFSPWGALVFALVGLGWYAWAAATHRGLLDYWLGDEVVGRIGTDEFGRNTEWYKPLVIYLPPLAIGLGLWSLVAAVPVLRQARRLWRSGVRAGLRDRPVLRFLAIWIAVPLVVLSIAKSRLPLYVLPLMAPLALVTARGLVAAWAERRLRRVAVVACTVSLALVVGGKAAVALMPSRKCERPLYEAVKPYAETQAVVINCTNGELYGLTFYLGRRPEPLELHGTDEQIHSTVNALALRVAGRSPGQRYAIVTRKKDMMLPQAFDQLGVDYRRVLTRQAAVLLVGDAAPPGLSRAEKPVTEGSEQ